MCWCILGDAGAVSRVDKMSVVKVYCNILSTRLTAPGSPRMVLMQTWTTNTQARIPLWLYHRVLISPFSSKSAQRKNYVSVKVEWVATVKFSLTWQMSTFCGLPWTYTIKLCSTSSWNGEDCIRGICIAGYIWEWDTADLSADELKNHQARWENGFCGWHGQMTRTRRRSTNYFPFIVVELNS